MRQNFLLTVHFILRHISLRNSVHISAVIRTLYLQRSLFFIRAVS